MRQLFIGLIAEGSTDIRFLKNIIQRSIQELSWQCDGQLDIFDIRHVTAEGDTFKDKMLSASHSAEQDYSLSILFIHADSDNRSINAVMQHKFEPLFNALAEVPDSDYCKHIVPTIPIRMIEAWMLADKELLKYLINASGKRDIDLGIEKSPETYADPKETIENAIHIAMTGKSRKKRDQIGIADLYELLGIRLDLNKLRALPSYVTFENNILKTFKDLGLMR